MREIAQAHDMRATVESELQDLQQQERAAQQQLVLDPSQEGALQHLVDIQAAVREKTAALSAMTDTVAKLQQTRYEMVQVRTLDGAKDHLAQAIALGKSRDTICAEIDAAFEQLASVLQKLREVSSEAYEHHRTFVDATGLLRNIVGQPLPLESRRMGWDCIHPDLTRFVQVMVQRFDELTRTMNRGAIVQFNYTETKTDTFVKANRELMDTFVSATQNFKAHLDAAKASRQVHGA